MNAATITVTALGVIAAVTIVAYFFFILNRRRNMKEISKERMPINKYTIAIDVRKRVFDIIEVDPNKVFDSTEVNIKKSIPISKLLDETDPYARETTVVKILKRIQGRESREKVIGTIKNTIGKTEKIRHQRKQIAFLTLSSFDDDNEILYVNWQAVNLNIEIFTELNEKETLSTESEAAKKISRAAVDYERPVLVRIKPEDSYTHLADPTFPPDEIMRIMNFWLSRKYVTSLTDRHNIYAVFETKDFNKSIPEEIQTLINKEIKYSRVFSKNISNKFDSIDYSYSLIEFDILGDSNVRSVMNSMTITKVLSKGDRDVIANFDPLDELAFRDAYEIISKKSKEAKHYAEHHNLNFSEDISAAHTVISTAIPNSVKLFINEYSVGIKQKYIENIIDRVKELSKNSQLEKHVFMIHWRFLFDIIRSGTKLPIPLLVYRSEDKMNTISLQFLDMLEATHNTEQEIILLMRNISPFYEKVIQKGNFESIVITPQAKTAIQKNISDELTLEYHKKLAKDRKVKIIEFK